MKYPKGEKMNGNKKMNFNDYYVEFLEQISESTMKTFLSTAEAYAQFMETLLKTDKDGTVDSVAPGNVEELREIYRNTLEHLGKMVEPLSTFHPNHGEITQLATTSAEKGFDFLAYWHSLVVDVSTGLARTSQDTLKAYIRMNCCNSFLKPGDLFNK